MNNLMDEAIEEIYQAALDPDVLPRMFETLCGFLHASHGFLLVLDESCLATHTHNLHPEIQRIYNEHYSDRDPWYLAANERGLQGRIMTGQELIPTRELRNTDFYHDILVPDEINDIMSVTISQPESRSFDISFQRSTNEPFFDPSDKARLASMLPHLGRMFRMRRMLEAQAMENNLFATASDQTPFGFLVLNSDGRVVHANQAAETILNYGDGLSCRNGRLIGQATDVETLSRAIALAIPRDGSVTPTGSEVAIRRTSGRLSYAVQIIPLRADRHEQLLPGGPAGPRGAVVVIIDPETSPRPQAARLRELFGLTPTEARIMLALAEGKSSAQIADELGIAKRTVRWHADNLRQKTGARRQSQIASLVIRSASTANSDPHQ